MREPGGSSEPAPPRRLRVGVFGASGTGGVELLHLLRAHPAVSIEFATSRSDAGKTADEVAPDAPAVRLSHPDDVDPSMVEFAFLCVPHGTAGGLARRCAESGARVIDLSGDHRLADADVHARVYGSERDEMLASGAAYGLTEWARPELRDAVLVANPGCYATTVTLALAPLVAAGIVGDLPVIDAKSGVSGAGRAPTPTTHFASVADDVRPYQPGREHRHVAEIEQFLTGVAPTGRKSRVVFTPHLVPLYRGIQATIFVPLAGGDAADVRGAYAGRYSDEPFIRLIAAPGTARILGVRGTNRLDIAISEVEGVDAVVVTAALDNLVKGAGGQAVQNMNVMSGLEETLGLPGAA